MDRNAYMNTYLHKRQESGLCIRCGKPIDRKGVLCRRCLEKERQYNRRLQQDLVARGICTTCHKRKTDGLKTCPECRTKASRRASAYYARKKMRPKDGDADG